VSLEPTGPRFLLKRARALLVSLSSRKAFINNLQLSPSAEAWLTLKSVEYRPFAASDSTQQVAIVVYPSPGSGSGDKLVFFRIGDLIAP